jgi:glutamate synthase domain-containing protein 2/glutamate synthase domain-containing protein 1/glutamate synthase domain-containing protein 3
MLVLISFYLKNPNDREIALEIIYDVLEKDLGVKPEDLAWRDVPVDLSDLSKMAKKIRPEVKQFFFNKPEQFETQQDFERALIVAQNKIKVAFAQEDSPAFNEEAEVNSLSSKRIIVKDVLRPEQLPNVYLDYQNENAKTSMYRVQHRMKTNSPVRAKNCHPYIFLSHNGEINNIEAITRYIESYLKEEKGIDITLDRNSSDTNRLDFAIAVMVEQGVSVRSVVTSFYYEAHMNDNTIPDDIRARNEYWYSVKPHAQGPANISAIDPIRNEVFHIQDPSGDRDAAIEVYELPEGEKIVRVSSDMGLVPSLDDKYLTHTSQVEAAEPLSVNLETLEIKRGDELWREIIEEEKSYGYDYEVNRKNIIQIEADYDLYLSVSSEETSHYDYMRAFGHDQGIMNNHVLPALKTGKEPYGAMHPHTTDPEVSNLPYQQTSYRKQQAAQMTNRAGDPKNEAYLFDTKVYLGKNRGKHQGAINIEVEAVLEPGQLQGILSQDKLKTATIDITYDIKDSPVGAKKALERIKEEALRAAKDGAEIIILSDRNAAKDTNTALDLWVAGSTVNQFLKDNGVRQDTSLIADTGQAMTYHQSTMASADGFDAVNPYLGHSYAELLGEGSEIGGAKSKKNYMKYELDGFKTIAAKPGIYTAMGYKGSQAYYFKGVNNKSCEVMNYAFGNVATSQAGGHTFREFTQNMEANKIASLAYTNPELAAEIVSNMPDDQYHDQVKKLAFEVIKLTEVESGRTGLVDKGIFENDKDGEKKYWSNFVTAYHMAYAANHEQDKLLKAELERFLESNPKPKSEEIEEFIKGSKYIEEHNYDIARYMLEKGEVSWWLDERMLREDGKGQYNYNTGRTYTDEEINLHHAPERILVQNQLENEFRRENPRTIYDTLEVYSDKVAIPRKDMGIDTATYIRECMGIASMSEGSISKEASRLYAAVGKAIGLSVASGEGGKEKRRMPGGKLNDANQNIMQIAAGRFGVDVHYVTSVVDGKETRRVVLEYKISQGAKDGQGGNLPEAKNDSDVASKRGLKRRTQVTTMPTATYALSVEEQGMQYEAFNPDFSEIEILTKQLTEEIKKQDPKIEIAVKLVANHSSNKSIAYAAAEGGANEIIIADGTGGTGSASNDAKENTGGSALESGWEIHNMLIENNRRDTVRLTMSGGTSTIRDKTVAHMFGFDRTEDGRRSLERVNGCVAASVCGANCPKHITTEGELYNYSHRMGEREQIYLADGIVGDVGELGYSDVRYGKENTINGKAYELLKSKSKEELEALGIRGDFDLSFLSKKAERNPDLEKTEGISEYKRDKIPDSIGIKNVVELFNDFGKSVSKALEVQPVKLQRIKINPNMIGVGRDLAVTTALNFYERFKDFVHTTRGTTLGKKPITPNLISVEYDGVPGHHGGVFNYGTTQHFPRANAMYGIATSGGIDILAPNLSYSNDYIPHENLVATNGVHYGTRSGHHIVLGGLGRRAFQRFSEGEENVFLHQGDFQANYCQYMTGGTGLAYPNNLDNCGKNPCINFNGYLSIYDPDNKWQGKLEAGKSDAIALTYEDMDKVKLNREGTRSLGDAYIEMTKKIFEQSLSELDKVSLNREPIELKQHFANLENDIRSGNMKFTVSKELGLAIQKNDAKAMAEYRNDIFRSTDGNRLSPYTAMIKNSFREVMKLNGLKFENEQVLARG